MKLSIVIPVYNEEKYLEPLLARVESTKLKLKKEIILVDDGSTDNSRKILKKYEKKYKVFYHERNKGKGAALITGFRHASGDITLVQDSDMEYDPSNYDALLEPILSGATDIVYGSRFKGKKMFDKDNWCNPSHFIGNKILSLFASVLYFRRISDMETCYKVFRRNLLKSLKLKSQRFGFEPEITAKFLKRGYKIVEVPIDYSPRGFREGKKITWKDGIKALWYLVKYRFVD